MGDRLKLQRKPGSQPVTQFEGIREAWEDNAFRITVTSGGILGIALMYLSLFFAPLVAGLIFLDVMRRGGWQLPLLDIPRKDSFDTELRWLFGISVILAVLGARVGFLALIEELHI